jgi:hypothetical protein
MRTHLSLARRAVQILFIGSVPFVPTGCKVFAVGDVHQIVVAVPTEIREALGDDLRSALEPQMFTSRPEAVFDVAYVDPSDPSWRRLRLVRHILLVGSADEPFVAEALGKRRHITRNTEPRLIQVVNVWAKRQTVTIALLPTDADRTAVRDLLTTAGHTYFEQFAELIDARTTLTGMHTTAASRFRRDVGYTLVLPARYRHEELEAGVFLFKDEDPSPAAPVIKMITVESQEPDEFRWSAIASRAWREQLARRVNYPPQVTDTIVSAVQGVRAGQRVIELRGRWSNPPGEWLAAGPFITQLVECPDRIYLIDAWLYAPASEKYELIAQLELILSTFRCAEAGVIAA